ncbi:YncE family protein [Halorubrum amylolyticum]|uniref:YncE family protein n=1 Tax=Halorubrum amylolyticum TaxID=2508724 RepID=UPI0010088817|nr:YncE family protein [Halorubrum amylolyticum]
MTQRHDAAIDGTASAATPTIVKNAASDHFSVLDLSRGEVVGEVGDGRYPHTAVFDRDAGVAYLLYIASAHLEVVDLDRLETRQRIDRLGTMPVGSAFAPDEGLFFVGTGVSLPDRDDPGVLAFAVDGEGRLEPVGSRALSRCAGMGIGPDGRLFVGLKAAGEVAVLTVDSTLDVAARIPVGPEPHDLYPLPEEALIAVNNAGASRVSFVDPAAETVRATATTGENPHGLAVGDGPNGRYAVVPARDDDRVAIVDLDAVAAGTAGIADAAGESDPTTGSDPTAHLVDVGTPTGFAATIPDGRYALVDAYADDRVTVLDPAAGEVVGRVTVGGEPLHLVFGPDGDRCYVGNMERREVAVLDAAPLREGRPEDVRVVDRIGGLGEKPSGIFRPEVDA